MNNETILRTFIDEVWNKKDTSRIGHFVDEAYTIHLDAGDAWDRKTLTLQEYTMRLQDSFIPFPDIHFAIESAVADADAVAITWIMTGTNLGNMGSVPPTGRAIKTSGVTIYHFNKGKLCGHTQVFDRTTVMKQLGFLL